MKKIMTKAFVNAITAAISVHPETRKEQVIDDGLIDQEIERMFGEEIRKKRRNLGIDTDAWKHRRTNPAARNYLSRGQRLNMKEPLRPYTIVSPMTPPKGNGSYRSDYLVPEEEYEEVLDPKTKKWIKRKIFN